MMTSDGTEIVSDARLFPFRNTFSRANKRMGTVEREEEEETVAYIEEREREREKRSDSRKWKLRNERRSIKNRHIRCCSFAV